MKKTNYNLLIHHIFLQRLDDDGAELWHEEIQACIDKANAIADEAERCRSI